jgi:hypothetical protein
MAGYHRFIACSQIILIAGDVFAIVILYPVIRIMGGFSLSMAGWLGHHYFAIDSYDILGTPSLFKRVRNFCRNLCCNLQQVHSLVI